MAVVVTALSTTAVKGLRLRQVQQLELTDRGARGDRAFYIVDEAGRMINGKQCGELQTVVADYDETAGELTLTFADGTAVHGLLEPGEQLETRFFSRRRDVRLVRGPWSEALSEHLARPLRIVQADSAVDRGREGAASLISRASLMRLAQEAGETAVDARRFRMLIEIDGVEPHAEDRWVGTRVAVGEAILAPRGHVGRCLITSRDPVTGEIDLPTLDVLGAYRRDLDSTEPLPFGIYAEVVQPGAVRVGDTVAIDG
jgi:uncharacterized protein